jgi:hypothetical protein
MDEKSRALDLKGGQQCVFCGAGTYCVALNALEATPAAETKKASFGINGPGARLLLLCCDRCGNVQTFRKDQAPNWSWE